MLGTGLIGTFYTMCLHGQRSRDRVTAVYSRTEARALALEEGDLKLVHIQAQKPRT